MEVSGKVFLPPFPALDAGGRVTAAFVFRHFSRPLKETALAPLGTFLSLYALTLIAMSPNPSSV